MMAEIKEGDYIKIVYKIKDKILENPKNPRFIKKDKFEKLVRSIKEFPEMLQARPLVVTTTEDGKFMVLGGNMRLKACIKARLEIIPIQIADDWSEEKKREFIIKDNLSYGEWDNDMLANEWDMDLLQHYGMDLPIGFEQPEEDIQPEVEFSQYLNESNNYVVLFFENDIDWLQAQTHFDLKTVKSKRGNGKEWSSGIGRVLNGADYLNKLN